MIYEIFIIQDDGSLDFVTTKPSFDEADTTASIVMRLQQRSVLIRRTGNVFDQGR